jgi:acyl carrier protein
MKDFILDWFASHSILSHEELEKNLKINYFEEGLIDSFAFLDLISECEETLHIEFDDDDFSNDLIFTIEGLINVLEGKQ